MLTFLKIKIIMLLLLAREQKVDIKNYFCYTIFNLRDCSSIGQSTALSRRKLRVRVPSIPKINCLKILSKKEEFLYFFLAPTFNKKGLLLVEDLLVCCFTRKLSFC